MTTTLRANGEGGLASIVMGESDVPLDEVPAQLDKLFNHKDELPFDQTLLQVDPNLRYSELMKIIDAFSKAGVTKMSFAELDGGPNP